jgi:hypothetical protein
MPVAALPVGALGGWSGRSQLVKERKKERFCTGLSASAMGPRAVAGGVYALGNHPESLAQQRYMHHNTNLRPSQLDGSF